MNPEKIDVGDIYVYVERLAEPRFVKVLRRNGATPEMFLAECLATDLRFHTPAERLRYLAPPEMAAFMDLRLQRGKSGSATVEPLGGRPPMVEVPPNFQPPAKRTRLQHGVTCLALVAQVARQVADAAEELGRVVCEIRAEMGKR